MKKYLYHLVGMFALLVISTGSGNATSITQIFEATTNCGAANCGTSGGKVTFTDLGSNQLQITFDNTTIASNVGPNTYTNSSVITGIVFNIVQKINAISSFTFVDGNGGDLSAQWQVGIDINNETTPNNTVFDIAFETTNGINGGIYNFANPGTNINNVFPDIAKLILTISNPNPFILTSIGDDSILRMQRVGTNGEGSLKIPTSSGGIISSGPIPEPGTLSLLGAAILGGLFSYQRRRQAHA